VLVQLDSDTVFLGEPSLALDDFGAAARPVDVVGMCSAGPGDPREGLWEQMCDLGAIDIDSLPFVETTIGRHAVRASYNGGFVVAQRMTFGRVEALFRTFVDAGVKPYTGHVLGMMTGAEFVSAKGMEHWGTSQAAISIVLAKMGASVRLLPATHNVPLHMLEDMATAPANPIHLHYHWLFGESALANPVLNGGLQLTKEQFDWLARRLPLGNMIAGLPT
jgi:hypothetical protein